MANRKPLNMYAYDALKEMIINNEYAPGTHLEEKDLCESLNISRTPLREAIGRLAYEGFVETVPKKGIFIAELSIQFITELFQARKALEPMIVTMSAKNLDKDKLVAFRMQTIDLINAKDAMKLHKFDYEFHAYLNSKCGNRHLHRAIVNIDDQFQRVRTQDFYPIERATKGAYEHLDIIDALVNESFDLIAPLIQKHISSTEEYYFMQLLKRTGLG